MGRGRKPLAFWNQSSPKQQLKSLAKAAKDLAKSANGRTLNGVFGKQIGL